MKVLLVGEDSSSLHLMATDLWIKGSAAEFVCELQALEEALRGQPPDVVIFDHIEPMDFYLLNPRVHGYSGPIIVLIGDDVPEHIPGFLEPRRTVRKPVSVEALLAELLRMAGGHG